MYKKKLMVKPLFQGLCLSLLSIILLSSCFRIFDERTVIDYFIRNSSSFEIIVEYSTINSEEIDSVVLLAHSNKSRIFRYDLDGLRDKPNDEEFSNYLHYLNIFVNDTLVFSQNPTDKQQWSLVRDSFDDEMNFYYYGFYVTDSLITHYENP